MSNWYDHLRFSCDWCNVRVDASSVAVLVAEICKSVPEFDPDQLVYLDKGQNFYEKTLSYAPAGYSAITFSFSPDETGAISTTWDPDHPVPYGVLVSVSGDGCRYLQSLSSDGLRKFLGACREFPHFCSRIDMAMDLFDKSNPIVPLFQEFSKVAYDENPGHVMTRGRINRADGYCRYMPVYDRDEKAFTDNVYIGDRTCTLGHVVCYNKKVEIREGRLKSLADDIFAQSGMTEDNYWYRIEYRAKVNTRRRDLSLSEPAFCAFLDQGAEAAFYYIADHLFTFVDFDENLLTNLYRCEVVSIWSEFLEWLGAYQNGHFVELDREGYFYVNPSVMRVYSYINRMKSLIYRIEQVYSLCPGLRDQILSEGERSHFLNPRYRSFDEDLRQLGLGVS